MKYIDKLNKLISSVTGMEGPYGSLLIDTILLFVLVKLVERLFNFFFGKVVKKNKTRFSFRKKVSFVCNLFFGHYEYYYLGRLFVKIYYTF